MVSSFALIIEAALPENIVYDLRSYEMWDCAIIELVEAWFQITNLFHILQ